MSRSMVDSRMINEGKNGRPLKSGGLSQEQTADLRVDIASYDKREHQFALGGKCKQAKA